MSTSREVPFLGKSRKISEMHGAEAAGGADGTSATGIEVRGTMFECDGACGFSGHYSEVDVGPRPVPTYSKRCCQSADTHAQTR